MTNTRRNMRVNTHVYRYNPLCHCDWCANDGVTPQGTPNNGHSFSYGNEHIPPAMRNKARIIALFSWFDEDPAWLTRAIESLDRVPVDHVVALDGPYALYSELHDTPTISSRAEHDAIRQACVRNNVSFEIHMGGFDGNEVEKRNRLFELGEQAAGAGDWYMVFDGDEFVTHVPKDPHDLLERTPMHVGSVDLVEPGHPQGTIHFPTFPMFFRAIPGLRCKGDHFTYVAPDGRTLWGDATKERLEPRAVTGLQVEHHNQLRDPNRRRRAMSYYKERDARGIEGLPAERFLTKA